jgi:DNA-binding SARP family transcriptional activator
MASGRLRIRLLGGLDLRQDETALPPLGSARAESLLALLLLHQEAAQPRQRLAFLLWPDSVEGQARTNLRHLLHVLRRALPDPDRFLEVTPRTLRWRPDAPCWLDVAAFDAALARSEREPGGPEAALAEAVELYAGDLLQGPTTSGWPRSGSGSASATSRPWSGWSSCWRRGATWPRRPGAPSGSCARTRCASRPTRP